MITDGNYLKPLSSKAAQYLEVKLIVARSSTSSWVLSISQAYFHSHDWLSRQWYFVRLKDRSQELLVLPFVKNSILTVRKRRSRAIIKPTISTFLVLICPPPSVIANHVEFKADGAGIRRCHFGGQVLISRERVGDPISPRWASTQLKLFLQPLVPLASVWSKDFNLLDDKDASASPITSKFTSEK